MRHLVFAVALASIRHVRTQNALVDSDRSASDLMQQTQRNVPCSLWSDTLYFFFVLVTKIWKTTRRSLTRPSLTRLTLMMLRRTWTALVQWCVAACMRAATCALAWVVAAVEHCKANTSLTVLCLAENKVGAAGATALADALQATVLTCGQHLFRPVFTVTANVASHDAVNSWRRRADIQFVLLLLRFFFVLKGSMQSCEKFLQVLCLCRQTPLAQSTEFSAAPVKNDRSAINTCRRCQLAATSLEVSRTLFHLGSPHAAVFLLGISGLAR